MITSTIKWVNNRSGGLLQQFTKTPCSQWPLSKYITSDNVLQNANPWESAWPACLLVIWWRPWRLLIQHSCNRMLDSGAFCQFLCPPPPSRWLQCWSLDLVVTALLGIPSTPWYAADLHCTLIWNLADVLSARDCLNSETLLITIFLSILLPFHQWTSEPMLGVVAVFLSVLHEQYCHFVHGPFFWLGVGSSNWRMRRQQNLTYVLGHRRFWASGAREERLCSSFWPDSWFLQHIFC